MVLAVALLVAGGALAVVGVRLATTRTRPLDLAGALIAPVGLLLALLGVGRWLSPSFFVPATPARAPGAVPAGPAIRIMPAGDAITQGSYGAGNEGEGGYRTALWQRLQKGAPRVDLVGNVRSGPARIDRDHEGWNGIAIEGLARKLERSLPVHKPEVVLLQIGTNDVMAGASPDVIEARLRALLDVVRQHAPRAHLLVATLTGVRSPNDFRVRTTSITAVNSRVRRLVAARAVQGDAIGLVDMNTRAARSPAALHADGLHPNAAGYAEMAAVWHEALAPLLRRR